MMLLMISVLPGPSSVSRAEQPVGGAVAGIVAAGQAGRRRRDALVPAAVAAAGQLEIRAAVRVDAGLVAGVADLEVAGHQDFARLAGRLDRGDGGADVGVVGVGVGAGERDHLGREADRGQRRALGRRSSSPCRRRR